MKHRTNRNVVSGSWPFTDFVPKIRQPSRVGFGVAHAPGKGRVVALWILWEAWRRKHASQFHALREGRRDVAKALELSVRKLGEIVAERRQTHPKQKASANSPEQIEICPCQRAARENSEVQCRMVPDKLKRPVHEAAGVI